MSSENHAGTLRDTARASTVSSKLRDRVYQRQWATFDQASTASYTRFSPRAVCSWRTYGVDAIWPRSAASRGAARATAAAARDLTVPGARGVRSRRRLARRAGRRQWLLARTTRFGSCACDSGPRPLRPTRRAGALGRRPTRARSRRSDLARAVAGLRQDYRLSPRSPRWTRQSRPHQTVRGRAC